MKNETSRQNNLMVNKPKLSQDEVGTLILLAAILFGTWFRIMPAWLAGFPVNDGGMFYTMMKDLQGNNYLPPFYTSYNSTLQIPFAYPPLALYVGAGLSDLLNLSLINVLQWLPALIHALCIPALYFLARELFGNKIVSATASLVFALTPHLNTWLSVGGGLTRSFGTFFLLLTILFSHKLLVKNDTRSVGWTILFGSLTVLSHTESTVFAIGIPIYIWLMRSRSLKSAFKGGLVALGVFLFAGPWYGLIIRRHGLDTLFYALQTGGQTAWSLLRLVNIDIVTEEPYLDLLGVLGILGLAALTAQKKYLLPLMLVIMYLIQPRSAHTVGNIPLAVAAGVFIVEILVPAISQRNGANDTRGIKVLLFILTPYLFVNSIYQGFLLSQNHISKGERTAMQWVRDNTPTDSRFLVLTGESDAMCESSAEWFPALSERTSLSTLQGREWLSDSQFGELLGNRIGLQNCINEDLECLNRAAKGFGTGYDYVYISIKSPTNNCKPEETSSRTTRGLALALETDAGYSKVYLSKDVIIFEKR